MAVKKETKQKLYIAVGLVAFFALLLLFAFSGDNFALLKSVFSGDLTNEELRDLLNDFGWRGYIITVVLAMLQVICVFLPAEPVQVLAGLTFGFPIGLLCCCIGILIGNTAVFLLHKTFGNRLHKFFVRKLHLDLEKIARSSKCVLIIFVLYFLPVIPYGMICFFAASTNMSYRRYITVTMLGALPSACIGVGLGYMTITSSWVVSVCVFSVLAVLLVVLMLKRKVLFEKLNAYADANKSTARKKVRKPNGFVLFLLYFAFKFYFFLCGVRVKAVNKIGAPKTPAIILCNHGSFIDFIYAAALLRKYKPNFVVARLYFYDKRLSRLLRTVGGFPKSMFATDPESTKNCIRVLKDGGVLAMMPEARLSTAGRFEDIQKGTYSFIKKSGVPVYTIKFNGDYFADPKWGKGFRRGAVVEAEMDILYTAEETAQLSLEQIQKGVEERLYYDEFEWLAERPNIKYRARRMAEGLENILTVCPACGQKHTITTEKYKIFCEKCGYLTSLDNRYSFTGDFRFENLAQWYDWQKALLQKEISENKDFALISPVSLRLPSKGKGLTRSAGQGVCTLSRSGLQYCGTKDGETVEPSFSIESIYRLLFGAGENFEIYNGTQILYFVPEERRSAVDWYLASMILYDEAVQTAAHQ
jgi:uncharacterized membrane protein YdjX (TVP38/TMEM64 family)/1-acyl-sn-glycerol-3-phosphate acyltransferase